MGILSRLMDKEDNGCTAHHMSDDRKYLSEKRTSYEKKERSYKTSKVVLEEKYKRTCVHEGCNYSITGWEVINSLPENRFTLEEEGPKNQEEIIGKITEINEALVKMPLNKRQEMYARGFRSGLRWTLGINEDDTIKEGYR